jgi:hypothetical protein
MLNISTRFCHFQGCVIKGNLFRVWRFIHVFVGETRERDHLQNTGVDGKIILE